jgi:hypothetical protein
MAGVAAGMKPGEMADPMAVKRRTQEALTYQPRTVEGKAFTEAASIPGQLIGKVADAAEKAVAPPKTSGPLQAALGYAARGLVEEAPALAGAKAPAVAGAAAKGMRGLAESEMQRALKPTITEVRKGQAQKAINAMLDLDINVSKGGLTKMQGRIDQLNHDIADVIAKSPATIDRNAVASYAQGTVDRFMKQIAPMEDVAAIQKVYDEFININPKRIPIQKAQELKTGTYQQLREKSYGELKTASTEAQKDIARGIKDAIANAAPEVRALNAEESKLLTALPMVERRALHTANDNLAGFAWLAHDFPKFAMYMADKSTLFHSLVARMLNKASESTTGTSAAVAGQVSSTPPNDAKERARKRRERVQREKEQSNATEER